jgi:CheY-like chemotaxis protein
MANILLIEDYLSLQQIYSKILHDSGHKVLLARNGEEGLALAETNPIDMILLDIMMPKVGGLEFLEAYKIKSHPDVKLIVLTNMTGTDFLNRAMELGASNYLVKSDITPQKLVKVIEDTLTESSAQN